MNNIKHLQSNDLDQISQKMTSHTPKPTMIKRNEVTQAYTHALGFLF